MKNCGNCAYCDLLITEEPCMNCKYTENWEPKEEDEYADSNPDTNRSDI